MIRIILLFLFPFALSAQNAANTQTNFQVVKNETYKGKALDALYKITYFKSGAEKRLFEVIKTDNKLKNFFLADYLVIEKISGNIKYYPLGWSTDKIKDKDIKANCESIVKGQVTAMVPE